MLLPGKDGCEAISYTQVWGLVGRYAAVLSEEGLRAGDRVCIFAEGSHEWALADWAARTLGVVVAPIYPTLPADQAQYIVQDCGAKLAIAGSAELAAKLSGVPILLLRGPGSLVERAEAVVVDEKAWNSSIEAIEPGDVSTIIYTSGTTGLPKGAMLSNRACGWVCGAILNNIPLSEADTFFSFLPMAHVFERIDGQILPLSLGATVGYCRSLMSMAGDLQKVRPTVILCVPRVLEALQEKVLDGVRKSPPMRRRLFALALAQGARRFYGKAAPLFWLTDRLVGRKVRTGLGGRLRLLVAGGAALPASVAEFYGAFRLTILQGYGLTETSSGVAVNHPDRNKFWTVGEVLPGMECEIAPDGEILFRGPACMEGYYNLPEETAAAIDDQGWFHTGTSASSKASTSRSPTARRTFSC
ncbi:MAG: AMP-binding protein [Fimbriimonas ginsengisoli]|uniref:AMP-binding protein n=1 Tax=Fimbriimonas ginsengisoli TaxID=1005039 RepID=A0A931LRJ4_FIMGI|nr:AMP-binding protein [Fimbriimonas ginsengisoli]